LIEPKFGHYHIICVLVWYRSWPQLETSALKEPKFGHDHICPSPSPSPRHVRPSITVPILHSSVITPAPLEADDDVFRAAPGATLTVDSCLVDGRPSLSSSADAQTDCTRVSGSDDSPLPDHRPSAGLTLAADADVHVRLVVPSSPMLAQSRDRMPTHRSQRSPRVGINFQLATAPRSAPRTTISNIKRSRKREKKVTKTLAIVLGKRTPYRCLYHAFICKSLSVPRLDLSFGSRAFHISAPKIWSSVPYRLTFCSLKRSLHSVMVK